MSPVWIWGTAVVLFAAFSLWYNNWKAPLSPAEIDAVLERVRERSLEQGAAREKMLRAFLEADDGGEFYMVNLLRMQPDPISLEGEPARPADKILAEYTGHFMPELFKRAGHPAFFARAAGRYIEHWGVEPDPGWSAAGVIRYRSRRDMVALASDPRFEPAHVYKIAALANTLAFPAAPGLVIFGPRIWIPLLLALIAALSHLGLLVLGSGS